MAKVLSCKTIGATLGYSIHRSEENLPPLVFVHGYGARATLDSYVQLLEALAGRYTVYAIDMRGHGASATGFDGWSLGLLAKDIGEFCSALKLEKPVFVGHSLGGFLGLLTEIDNPGIFSSICLVTPASPRGQRSPDEMVQFFIEHGQNKDALRGMFAPMYAGESTGRLEAVVEANAILSPEVHRSFFEEFARTSIEEELAGLTLPTLLLIGAKDVVVDPGDQHRIGERMPRCKEVRFTVHGHMLPQEAASVTAREILNFLAHDADELRAA